MDSFVYQTGGALKGDFPGYVSRPADTDLVRSLLQGSLCYVLTARQTGKSSLKVRAIAELTQTGWTCVDIDLTTFGTKNIEQEQWYFTFLNEIAMSLDLEDAFEDWWLSKTQFTAVARFSMFWGEFLLPNTEGTIGIFIDEIDSMLTLRSEHFSTDDFFAAIRAVYNAQSVKEELDRIRFCIIGVALADDLMEDPARTPFNIGKAINLDNFLLEDAGPLAAGLRGGDVPAENLLASIMSWSWGQPYLTQRLCEEIRRQPSITNAQEAVDQAVQGLFLQPNNLSSEDNLANVDRRVRAAGTHQAAMLSCYSKILTNGMVPLDLRRPEQVHLKLTGLVKEEAGGLVVNNRIYREVFNQEWVDRAWYDMERPFALELRSWIRNNRSEDYLLRGNALTQAIFWSQDHESISRDERDFIEESRAAADKRKDRERNFLVLGLMALAVMMLSTAALAIYTLELKRKADDAYVRSEDARKDAEKNSRTAQYETANAETKNEVLEELYKQLGLAKNNEEREKIAAQIAQKETFIIQKALEITNAVERIGSDHPALAMRLAEFAYKLAPSPIVRSALLSSYRRGVLGFSGFSKIGIPGRITSADVSSGGKYLLVGASDNSIRIWNRLTGNEVKNLGIQRVANSCVAYQDNGTLIATGGEDHIVKIYDRRSGEMIYELRGHQGPITALRFHPYKNILFSGSEDHAIKSWNLALGNEIMSYENHKGGITAIMFNKSGEQFLTASKDFSVKLWQEDQRLPIRTINCHNDEVLALVYHPSQQECFTASRDQTIKRIDLRTYDIIDTLFYDAPISALAIDSKGQNVIVGGMDGAVCFWNLQIGDDRTKNKRALRIFPYAHINHKVIEVQFTPSGKEAISIGTDNAIHFWKVNKASVNLEKSQSFYSGNYNEVLFDPVKRQLITAGDDNIIRAWELKTGVERQLFLEHNNGIMAMAFDPNKRMIVSAGGDNVVYVWDVDTKKNQDTIIIPQRILSEKSRNSYFRDKKSLRDSSIQRNYQFLTDLKNTQHPKRDSENQNEDDFTSLGSNQGQKEISGSSPKEIRAITFSPDGTQIVIGTRYGTAIIYDLQERHIVYSFHAPNLPITAVAYSNSRDGLVATGHQDGTIRLWKTGKSVPKLVRSGHKGHVSVLTFYRSENFLFSGGADGQILLWDLWNNILRSRYNNHSGKITSLDFRGSFMLSGSVDQTAKLWIINQGVEVQSFENHNSSVKGVFFDPDKTPTQPIFTVSTDNSVRMWDWKSGLPYSSVERKKKSFLSYKFDEKNDRILASADTLIYALDIERGAILREFKGHSRLVLAVDYHAPSGLVLSGSKDGSAILWNYETGKKIRPLEGHAGPVNAVAISPNGKYGLTCSGGNQDKSAVLWDLSTGKLLHRFGGIDGHTDDITYVSFNPNEAYNQLIATASEDGTAKIWDINSGELVGTCIGHTDEVEQAIFSPDGKKLLTASDDQTARLWDVNSATELVQYGGHNGQVVSINFNKSGTHIVTGTKRGEIRVWGVDGLELQRSQVHKGRVHVVTYHPTSGLIYSIGNESQNGVSKKLLTCVKPIEEVFKNITNLEELEVLLQELSPQELKRYQLEGLADELPILNKYLTVSQN